MTVTPRNIMPMILAATLLLSGLICGQAKSQTTSNETVPNETLNLRDKSIIRELVKEEPETAPVSPTDSTRLRGGSDSLDASFVKADKHGIIPTTTEINVTGAPQRVTKVTGADGSYCVYTPTVARTDGIDEIQNGLQNQVRSCPQ